MTSLSLLAGMTVAKLVIKTILTISMRESRKFRQGVQVKKQSLENSKFFFLLT